MAPAAGYDEIADWYWGYWLGTVSLVIEAALIVLGVTMLMARRQRAGHRLVVGRLGQLR